MAASSKPLARRIAEWVASPSTPEDYLDLISPLLRRDVLRARVVSIHPETADAATITLRPSRGWRGHIPGQYVRVGVDIDGVRHWRAYSLTHARNRLGRISITVKAVKGGTVSPYLVHRLKRRQLIHLDQAQGDFVLPQPKALDVLKERLHSVVDLVEAPRVKLLFVTAGSGITPVIGILRNLYPVTDAGVMRMSGSDRYDIVVAHIAPSRPDSIFNANLRALGEAGAIRLIDHFTDAAGRFDVDTLDDLVPDLRERVTYAAGPNGLLAALEEHHAARGLRLYTERFRPSAAETSADSGEHQVTFAASGVTVSAPADRPLLDVGEEAGVLLPSGCRMGICFGCVSTLTEGSVRDLRDGEVTTATMGETDSTAGGISIQTCVSAAASPCTIER